MKEIVPLIPLCLFTLMILGCESFMKKESKKTCNTDSSSIETASPAQSKGYLASGATVNIDTGEENRRMSLLEQFEQSRKDLASSLEKIAALERELESEKAIKTTIETELEELKKQLEATQQLIIENERLGKQLEQNQAPYEKRIRELTLELTKAQIEETRAKQELIGLKIEQLVEKKKQKTQNSQ
jgi:chromosome segregation ATPase